MALDRDMSGGEVPLRRLVGKGAAWSTLDVALGRFGQFVQGIVVARIVAPREFGVFAVALVVHAVLINISELGVSVPLIRDDPRNTPLSAPTIATISLTNSVVLAIAMAALSPVLAAALGSPRAAGPIAVMALTLPLAGLTAVPSAILKRDFRMDRIFVANFANMLTSGLIVVLLALSGWGALALAWSWVAGQLVMTVILLSYRTGRYWPGWRRSEARRLLAFGIPLAGGSLLSFLVLNVDYVVVGRLLGAEALGLYVLAFNISGWPLNVFGAVVRSVSLPGFSRLRRGGEAMPEHFLRALRFVAGVTMPICFILGALAGPMVIVLYGRRWSEAASALVGLSVLGAARILLELSGDYLVAVGRNRALIATQLPWLVVLASVLVLVAPTDGIGGVGTAQALVAVAFVGPIYAVLLRRVGVGVRAAVRALSAPTLWALLAAAVAYAVSTAIGQPVVACAAGGIAGLAVAALPFAPALVRHSSSMARARWAVPEPPSGSVQLTAD
ncbi:MAG: lipopolysaccharide biosynthesis protein [Actinomycetota bacterium]|nr:lipopolysaccharide biosynthesis protein [Actinomycetota bacterium]